MVDLTVELTTPACPLKAKIESDIVDGLEALGATAVRVDWASNVKRSFGGPAADLIPGVKNTIAVASGKGGVGKTTVAVNLAVSLARDGARVGLLDADITGPNVPLMMGTVGSHVTGASGRVNPVTSHGVKMMSIQYFLTGGCAGHLARAADPLARSSSSCATWSGASSTTWWSTCRRAPATPRYRSASSSRCRARWS